MKANEGTGTHERTYLNQLRDFFVALLSQRSLKLSGGVDGGVAAQVLNLGLTKDDVCVRCRALVDVRLGDDEQDLCNK